MESSSGKGKNRRNVFVEYEAFRRKVWKKNVTFLDSSGRERRKCETADELMPFLEGILRIADKAEEEGRDIVCCLDVEGDVAIPGKSMREPQPFYWHKRQLREEGVSEELIAERERKQKQMSADWARKNPKSKRNNRDEYNRTRRESGLAQSNVFSFQVGCVQDKKDKFLFAANTVKIADSSLDGGVTAPPLLKKLFCHRAVLWVNVGIAADIEAMNQSFFSGSLHGMRILELKQVVELYFGGPLTMRDDAYGMGGLGIFRRVFSSERLTYDKHPRHTLSDWSAEWSPEMLEYALNDVYGVNLVMRKITPALDKPLSALATTYPLPIEELSRKITFEPTTSRFTDSPTTEAFEFNSSSSDSEAFEERPADAPSFFSELQVEQMNERWESDRRERARKLAEAIAKPPILPKEDEDWNEDIDNVGGAGILSSIDEDDVLNGDDDDVVASMANGRAIECNSGDIDEDALLRSDNSDGEPAVPARRVIEVTLSESDVASSDSEVEEISIPAERAVEIVDPADRLPETDYLSGLISSVLEPVDDDIEAVMIGAPSSSRGGGPETGATSPAHTVHEYEVDEVDEDTFIQPLMRNMTSSGEKLGRLISRKDAVNVEQISKSLPLGRGPEILAEAAKAMKISKKARKNYTCILKHLSTKWSEGDKSRYLDLIKQNDPLLSPTKVIEYLKIENFEIELALGLGDSSTVNILKEFPGKVEAFVSMITKLYGGSPRDKMNHFKSIKGYSNKRASSFLDMSVDTVLSSMMNLISKIFAIPAPLKFRRQRVLQCINESAKKMAAKKMTFESAVDRIDAVVGEEEDDRDIALSIMHPHISLLDHFRGAWMEGKTDPPRGTPLECPNDDFHADVRQIINVQTNDLADMVVERVASAEELFVACRCCNDYRFDPTSPGAIGFTAKHWEEVFILWPYTFPAAAAKIAASVASKPLHVVGANLAEQRLGSNFHFVDLCSGRTNGENQHGAMKRVLSAGAHVNYCQNYWDNVFVSPSKVDKKALMHLAAEVGFLSECVKQRPFLDSANSALVPV